MPLEAKTRLLGVGLLAATSPRLESPTCRHAFEERISWLAQIEPKVLELSGPFRGGIAQALDIDAARKAAFNRCLDELGSEKRERDRQIDLTHGASLAPCQL